jgi:uncharacterized protein YciI
LITVGYFVVTRDAGPGWTARRGAFEQPEANDHAAFMNNLAEGGFLVLAGPLAGSESGRIRVLLMARAETEAEVTDRLADDPWARSQRLVTTRVESWIPVVGGFANQSLISTSDDHPEGAIRNDVG